MQFRRERPSSDPSSAFIEDHSLRTPCDCQIDALTGFDGRVPVYEINRSFPCPEQSIKPVLFSIPAPGGGIDSEDRAGLRVVDFPENLNGKRPALSEIFDVGGGSDCNFDGSLFRIDDSGSRKCDSSEIFLKRCAERECKRQEEEK